MTVHEIRIDRDKTLLAEPNTGHNRWHPDIPPNVTVRPGDVFRADCREWFDGAIKNDDSAEHSVTSDTADKFDVHVDGKEQGTLTAPTEPGEYAFHCVYHPSMHGTLIVK